MEKEKDKCGEREEFLIFFEKIKMRGTSACVKLCCHQACLSSPPASSGSSCGQVHVGFHLTGWVREMTCQRNTEKRIDENRPKEGGNEEALKARSKGGG